MLQNYIYQTPEGGRKKIRSENLLEAILHKLIITSTSVSK